MARVTLPAHVVRTGVFVLFGVACMALVLTTAATFRRAPASKIAATPAAMTSPTPDQPGPDEHVRLAFHAEVETLKARLAAEPENANLLLDLAKKYQDGHKPADAVDYYQRYLAIDETNEQAWLDLASCFSELEDWTRAEDATRSLLEVNPLNASALYNLGAIRANAGDFDEARRLWEQIRDEQPHAAAASQAKTALTRLAHLLAS